MASTGVGTRAQVFEGMDQRLTIRGQLSLLYQLGVVLIPIQKPTAFDLGAIGVVAMLQSPLLEGFVVGEPVGVGFCQIL